MAKTAEELKGYKVGDIMTLSDLQTQMEFDQPSYDFTLIEVRNYKESGGMFEFIGYVVENPDEQKLMLLVRTMGEDYDLMFYYLDQDGDIGDFESLLSEDGDDFIDEFDAEQEIDGKQLKAGFKKKSYGTVFGVEHNSSSDSEETIKTIAEYLTEDEYGGNNHAFIEWSGDNKDGYFELWYGCEFAPHEIEINSVEPD